MDVVVGCEYDCVEWCEIVVCEIVGYVVVL